MRVVEIVKENVDQIWVEGWQLKAGRHNNTSEKHLLIQLEAWDWREYRDSMSRRVVGISIKGGIETEVTNKFSQDKLPEK